MLPRSEAAVRIEMQAMYSAVSLGKFALTGIRHASLETIIFHAFVINIERLCSRHFRFNRYRWAIHLALTNVPVHLLGTRFTNTILCFKTGPQEPYKYIFLEPYIGLTSQLG
jgi:hypothetical protein